MKKYSVCILGVCFDLCITTKYILYSTKNVSFIYFFYGNRAPLISILGEFLVLADTVGTDNLIGANQINRLNSFSRRGSYPRLRPTPRLRELPMTRQVKK